LFVIGRESNFRQFCQMIVEARYIRSATNLTVSASSAVANTSNPNTNATTPNNNNPTVTPQSNKENANQPQATPNNNVNMQDQYKQIYKFLGMVSYLDWIMIIVTIQSCIGMWFESPTIRLVETIPLQIVEYVFVICMGIEMTLKVCAYGLFFTPNAVVKDFGGILDLFIFTVRIIFLY
jgi:hypothetical protein